MAYKIFTQHKKSNWFKTMTFVSSSFTTNVYNILSDKSDPIKIAFISFSFNIQIKCNPTSPIICSQKPHIITELALKITLNVSPNNNIPFSSPIQKKIAIFFCFYVFASKFVLITTQI